jgi:caffeoyl-CoA O-methyltransferase
MADPDSRAGARYATEEILDWVHRVHGPHDPALAQAYGAPEREGMPAIQVGPTEGRLLQVLVRLAGAQKAVEIGTLAGYSAIWMARALGEGGRLWTVESEPAHAEVARSNIAQAGLQDRVEVLVGDALERLPELDGEAPFDVVFLDADKGHYDRYAAWAADRLRPGGLLIGDNAYFFGRLLDDDPEALAMRRFHEQAAQRFLSSCIPTPDGLVVAVRR